MELPIDKIKLLPALRTHIYESAMRQYAAQVDPLVGKGPGRFSKKQAEDLKAGFADGVLTVLGLLTEKLEA